MVSCLFFVNNVSATPTNTPIPNSPPTIYAVALKDLNMTIASYFCNDISKHSLMTTRTANADY